jgi:hypothetical protein
MVIMIRLSHPETSSTSQNQNKRETIDSEIHKEIDQSNGNNTIDSDMFYASSDIRVLVNGPCLVKSCKWLSKIETINP